MNFSAQAGSLLALMKLYGENRIEKITEEGHELSSSDFLLKAIWSFLYSLNVDVEN